jgi:hypothetical protein
VEDSLPLVLYHYTSLVALQSILESNQLWPSLRSARPRDVRYGDGQYLTDIAPGRLSGAQLSRFLLGQPFEAHRFTHFIALNVDGLIVRQGRTGVFVIPNSDSLSIAGRIVGTGRNRDDLSSSRVDA